ncbi:MAG TPA: ABC transporter ATP-binding protein [Steroidobacteraceae bacterium]|nr:ABC transporter ATP-binding protein [Steroidobacteraceae bacterium]
MTEALLEVRGLTVSYDGQTVVDSLSFDVAPGRCLGVIGESGAGKSQAFLAMLGLAGAAARVGGTARLRGDDLLGASAKIRGRRVAMIFQDPLTSLTPHLRIGAQIAEPLMTHRGFTRAAAHEGAARLLEQVRVNDVPRRLRQYPHELSGGMRQRVMIAMALACDPELLIADEPTTALDVSVQAQLLALLRQLIRERNMALVVVTHDMGVIAALADEVVVMRAGRIVDRGPVASMLAAPGHEYTRALVAAAPRMDDAAMPRIDTPSPPFPAALEARAVTVVHRLRAPLLRKAPVLTAVDALSLRVGPGEALGIVGESGCGKSSLARALLRLHDVASGEIVWLGSPIQHSTGKDLLAVRSGLQMVFQDPVASLDPLQSVADIVVEPLQALRPQMSADQRRTRAREMLERVGLGPEFAARRSHALSGGQCQRVAIARAMVLEPKLLVCDEAVSSLDVSIQAQILDLLADIKRRGTGIVFVSHNLAVVRRLCERVLVMYLGRAVESGPTGAVFRAPRHPYTRMLLEAVPLLDPVRERERLDAIIRAGQPTRADHPSAVERPAGCAFHPRCPLAQAECAIAVPGLENAPAEHGEMHEDHFHEAKAHEVACLRWRDIVKSVPPGTRNPG